MDLRKNGVSVHTAGKSRGFTRRGVQGPTQGHWVYLSALPTQAVARWPPGASGPPCSGPASPVESQNLVHNSLSKNPDTDSSLTDLSLGLSLDALLMGGRTDVAGPGPASVAPEPGWGPPTRIST